MCYKDMALSSGTDNDDNISGEDLFSSDTDEDYTARSKYLAPDRLEEFANETIPISEYDNRAKYLHKLNVLVEGLLIGHQSKCLAHLRAIRSNLVDFWLRDHLVAKHNEWQPQKLLVWVLICRLSYLMIGEDDIERTWCADDQDPNLAPVSRAKSIFHYDMITLWRAVRILSSQLSHRPYSQALRTYLEGLMCCAARFMITNKLDVSLPFYRPCDDDPGQDRFIRDTESAFLSLEKTLRVHEDLVERMDSTRCIDVHCSAEQPFIDWLFRFFRGPYKGAIIRAFNKAIHSCFVDAMDRERFQLIFPHEDATPRSILERFRPFVIDRLYLLTGIPDDDQLFGEVVSDEPEAFPLLAVVIIDYFIKCKDSGARSFDIQQAHIFLSPDRSMEALVAQKDHPILIHSLNEWFVVDNGRLKARGDQFASVCLRWMALSASYIPCLGEVGFRDFPALRESSSSAAASSISTPYYDVDVEDLPDFY